MGQNLTLRQPSHEKQQIQIDQPMYSRGRLICRHVKSIGYFQNGFENSGDRKCGHHSSIDNLSDALLSGVCTCDASSQEIIRLL